MRRSVWMQAIAALCVLAFALAGASAHAESFALNEYSTRELGRANAGTVVQAEDAGAAFGNPALMSLFREPTVTVGVSSVFGADERFDDAGSVDVLGAPLGGDTAGFLEDSYIPAFHVIYPLDPDWAVGLSISAPFGLATSYSDDWPGRYQALHSEVITINVNPSLSWRVSRALALGAGFSFQYAEAKLSSAIDFGAVCFGALGPPDCTALGLTPQAADGRLSIEGDDWSLGYNAGVVWTPHDNLRVGLHYRSEVEHRLEGRADFTVPDAALPLTAGGLFADTPGAAGLNLPATAELGVFWRAGERLDLYANVRRRFWSSLEEIRVEFDNPAQPDSVEPLNYEDSWRFAVGADYRLDEAWTVRAGVAFDETPTQPEFRTPRISDDERMYYAVGASWRASDSWEIDFAYNRVEIEDHDTDRTGSFGDRLVGHYSGAADVFSLGATYRFGATG